MDKKVTFRMSWPAGRDGPAAKGEGRGFTLVELLTVLAIITMLVSMLVPSLNMARRVAKETKQKAQFTAIGAGLEAFRKDFGDYPESFGYTGNSYLAYCGAQKLTEALLGRDLMGFHPRSSLLGDATFYPELGTIPEDAFKANLQERKGRYLELHTANAFRLGDDPAQNKGGLFTDTSVLLRDTFVICDVFGAKRITLPDGSTVKAGAPVLYYRANTSSKIIHDGESTWQRIYDARDNYQITYIKEVADGKEQPLETAGGGFPVFYTYISDPKVPGKWPYRPDSYILISAGVDGIYGTPDDIKNFGY